LEKEQSEFLLYFDGGQYDSTSPLVLYFFVYLVEEYYRVLTMGFESISQVILITCLRAALIIFPSD
jgi:hypothetical protein